MTVLFLAAFLAPQSIDVDDALIAANAGLATVDVIQTVTCLRQQICYEANPILAPLASRPAALAAVSLGGRGASLWLLDRHKKRHPKVVRAVLIGLAVVQGYVVFRD